MSRGLQNCNPGNIRQSKVRYKGEVRPSRDPAFKQFESLAWGYRAIFVLLDTYRIRYGLDTIRGMISRWAPPSENHTETYIRTVADAVGIPDRQPLDTRDRTTMLRMAAAISRVENGAAADMGEVELGWELFVRDKPASGSPARRATKGNGKRRRVARIRKEPAADQNRDTPPEYHTKQSEFTIFAEMKAASLSARLDRMPMVKAVAPFAAGILAADCFTLPLWFLAGAFLLSGTLALLLRSQSGAFVMLLTAGFAASQLRDTAHTLPRGIYTTYELTVEGIPSDRGRYTSAEATAVAWRDPSHGTWHASGDRIMLYADSLTALYSGERIRCRGSVRPFRGGAESYRRLMARRGFAGTLWLSERTLIERLPGRSSALHLHAVERMQRIGLQSDAGAVCRAMVTGDRSGITQELRTVYSRSGLSHLLAVSGLHTGIVFALVNLMLWWLPLLHRGHLVRNLLATVCIWLFVAAAGFSPSAVRAAVMCTMLQFALASASEYVALNALAAAGFGMLLWNPAWLGDISFQLSFIAVAAILAWGVPLCRLLHTRWRALNLLTDALVISLVAGIATAPLVSHTFGTVPLAGLLVNPVAILVGSIVVLGGTVWMILPVNWLAPTFDAVLSGTAGLLNTLARAAAALPGGYAEYTLGGGATAGIYLFFLLTTLAAWSFEPKKSVHLPA